MDEFIGWLRDAPLWEATLVLLAENALIFVLALALGRWLVGRHSDRPVADPPPPLGRTEIAVALGTVFLNTATPLVGLFLWRAGLIQFRTDAGMRACVDVLALLVVMDLAMYLLHRLAHHRLVYPTLHRLHHEYDRPRPLTLFVLNPAENLAFGALWLIVVTLYPASWAGMSIYLVLNVLSGTVGHLGVEPLPARWARIPLLRYIAGATFHARHHQQPGCNFGFYTLIWDRLFGTLGSDYWETFGKLPASRDHNSQPIRSTSLECSRRQNT